MTEDTPGSDRKKDRRSPHAQRPSPGLPRAINLGITTYYFAYPGATAWRQGGLRVQRMAWHSEDEAAAFLEQFADSPEAMTATRWFYAEANDANDTSRLQAAGILRSLARDLYFGRLELYREEPYIIRHKPKIREKREEKQKPAPLEAKHYLSLRIVEDSTDMGVSGVELVLTKPDGTQMTVTTDDDGAVEQSDVPLGRYSVVCKNKGESIFNTWHFVCQSLARFGPTDTEPNGQQRQAKAFVSITARRVRTGDTFKALAEEAGVSPKELARFNWGVDAEDKLAACLYCFVGCRIRDEEGFLILDDSDNPGIVYLPMPCPPLNIRTDQPNVIRLAQVGRRRDIHYSA